MKKAILLILFISSVTCLNAFEPGILKFQHLGNNDGLSSSWVKSIFKDSYGYLWFGTGDGLNKYNGYDFIKYKHSIHDKTGLTNNTIYNIYEDKNGTLWVGSQSGISVYNRELDQFFKYPILNDVFISDFLELKNGLLAVLTHSGLYTIDPENQSVVSHVDRGDSPGSLPHEKLNDILRDHAGNIWIATYNGLCLLDTTDQTFIRFQHQPDRPGSIAGNIIRSIIQDSRDRIWIGTNENGLSLMHFNHEHPAKTTFLNFRHNPYDINSISSGAILSLLEDKKNNLWIGTENGGMDILPVKNLNSQKCVFHHYQSNPNDPNSISSNSIHSLFQDDVGTIWIGTYSGGINYYNPLLQKFKHYKHLPSSNTINNNVINSIYDEKDRIWIGTESGLNVQNKKTGKFTYYTHHSNDPYSIGSDAVLCIHRDKRRNLWIGTWGGGLNLLHEKSGKFTRYEYDPSDPNSIESNNIASIMSDDEGMLWLATMNGGLSKFDINTKHFTNYRADLNDPLSISNDWTWSLLQANPNEIWVSTTMAVDIFNKRDETFFHFTHDSLDDRSITYNGAIVMIKDSRDHIWLGTENGLNCYNPKDSSFIYYLQEDGLPNNTIKGIVEDDHGNLWISTNNGISKFVNGINLPGKPKFENYSIDDGLQDIEFNRRAYCRGNDGTIYFGGNFGYNVFNPDSIRDNFNIPEIVFTELLIFNSPVKIGGDGSPLEKHISLEDEIRLQHSHSVFSIEYAALNFLAPYQNQYAFKLDGFDKEWNYVGKQRLATYTNLNPGKYVFHVKGSNNDGIWNEKGNRIRIVIKPPFWMTTWFHITSLFTVLILIFAGIQLRTAKIRSRNRELEHHVKERTMQLEASNRELEAFSYSVSHDLRAPLRGMDGFSQSLLEEYTSQLDDRGRHYIERIHTASKRMGQLIDDLLKLSRVTRRNIQRQRINLSSLVETIAEEFRQMDPDREVTFKISKKIYAKGDISLIQIMLRNLIDNAWKFTSKIPSAIIEFGMIHQNKKNIYYIRDNGIGLNIQYSDKIFEAFHRQHLKFEGTGIGLATAQRIVIRHGGHIWADGKENKGATFYFTLSDE